MSDLLNSASLVMIPSGYKEDTVFSQIPTDGSGDLSFTRASNGTRVNSAGLVEDCPWNEFEQSETFENSYWTKDGATITTNATTAPNGTTTAEKIEETATTGVHRIGRATFPSGTQRTLSVYAKKAERNYVSLFENNSAGNTVKGVIFNLNTGVVSTNNDSSYYFNPIIENIGNGWYRCSVNWTPSGLSVPSVGSSLDGSTNSYSGTAGNGIYIYGAQLNIGATAKPYFPTTDRLNVPRLTYQNGGGGCPSLLLEKQSTNLFTYSEQFDNAAWTKSSGSVTANQAISPDGTQNADLLTGEIYQQPTFTNATTYSFSVFAKKESGSTIYLGYIDNVTGFVGGSITYTYSTGVVAVQQSANGSVSGQAIDMGNGWIRVIMKYTTIAVVTFNYQYIGSTGSYVWGAQCEVSSYPTSYIPTTSSSATRVADACFKTSATALIGQTEGTMFGEIQVISGETNMLGWMRKLSGGVYGDVILAYVSSAGLPNAGAYVGGVNQVAIAGTTALSAGYHKMAFAYKQNDFVLYVDGVQIGTDTSGSVPTCDELYIDQYIDGGSRNATKKQFILFKTRLTNAELASLTTI